MCGIIGVIGGDAKNSTKNVTAALDLIKNRGPDATLVSEFTGIVLGHNRLSVIDLASAANQPMLSSCGRYVIVFNGEIYNYKQIKAEISSEYQWKTNSDTEVILASYIKWGTRSLAKLRGMFSFGIWDIKEKKLFAARDRLGVKPFYYRDTGKSFYFGSRPDAVLKASGDCNVQIDTQSTRFFLESGYIPAPYTIYQELKKLPPGHFLSLQIISGQNSLLKIEKYWSLDQIETDLTLANKSEVQLVSELETLVHDSVRLRMISDVPTGVFLSGGIDSSLIAAMMSKISDQPVKSFSIGFSDKEFDELSHANAVAKYLGTDHHVQKFEVDDLLKFMPTFLSQYDEPFFDYSAFPVMAVSKMAGQHVKVALSGDGGDEAFGGYHYYQLMQLVDKLQNIPISLRRVLADVIKYTPVHKIQLFAGLLSIKGGAESYAYLRSVIKNNKKIFSKELLQNTKGLEYLFAEKSKFFPLSISGAELGMRLDIAYTLPDDYLQKVDVGSMAFSLEARDPLLDHQLFEWAAKLPLCWKINGTNKYLLRQLAYKYIPKKILDRPKMGFGVPMAKWLRGPLRLWAEPLILDNDGLMKLGLIPEEVQKIWKQHQQGRVQAHTILWSIAVLQAFRAERSWL